MTAIAMPREIIDLTADDQAPPPATRTSLLATALSLVRPSPPIRPSTARSWTFEGRRDGDWFHNNLTRSQNHNSRSHSEVQGGQVAVEKHEDSHSNAYLDLSRDDGVARNYAFKQLELSRNSLKRAAEQSPLDQVGPDSGIKRPRIIAPEHETGPARLKASIEHNGVAIQSIAHKVEHFSTVSPAPANQQDLNPARSLAPAPSLVSRIQYTPAQQRKSQTPDSAHAQTRAFIGQNVFESQGGTPPQSATTNPHFEAKRKHSSFSLQAAETKEQNGFRTSPMTSAAQRPGTAQRLVSQKQENIETQTTAHSSPTIVQSIESGPPTPLPATSQQPRKSEPSIIPPETISRHGLPYSKEEDELLFRLRQEPPVPWSKIKEHFNGRTQGSLQVRYSTLSARKSQGLLKYERVPPRSGSGALVRNEVAALAEDGVETRLIPKRGSSITSRAESSPQRVGSGTIVAADVYAAPELAYSTKHRDIPRASVTTGAPRAGLSHLLRQRELSTFRPSHNAAHNLSQLKEQCLSTLGGTRYLDDTSGDVSAVAWSSNGNIFAAGGVVLSDESSMQYNKPRNLLLGGPNSSIRELPDHYVARSTTVSGVNSLPSMQSSQDPRLFTTVQMVAFSKDDQTMYSASIDSTVNAYKLGSCVEDAELAYRIHHTAPVDLLSVNDHGNLATGSRAAGIGCVKIFRPNAEGTADELQSLGPERSHVIDIFPSALRWGVSPHHSSFLLAGFSQGLEVDEDDDYLDYGDTCLFDGNTGQSLTIQKIPRSVFDVAWNPNLGKTSFAVAGVGYGKLNRGMHSVVRLYSDISATTRCSLELECPARDINDVVYCPFDENLIAAGSTDGKVYLWDMRYANVSQIPRRQLAHGSCIGVLEHDRPRWEADTGIRFLQWGNIHTTLFSGSSDGVIKCWNPYLAPSDNHVYDVYTGKAAIMSGAFSPDCSRLLIGEDGGRLNMLEVGNEDKTTADMERFPLISAPEPVVEEEPPHHALLATGKIVFENCGPLPIRQAVQNPDLPYNITFGNRQTNNQYPPSELLRLRWEAAAFQKKLHKSRKAWKKLKQAFPYKVHACELDCGFLPQNYDETPDSQKSLSRIPDALRSDPPKGLRALQKGLVAKCHACLEPAHAAERDDEERIYCQKCRFACLRCSRKTRLNMREHILRCESCDVTWDVGVLGYDIKQTTRKMEAVILDETKGCASESDDDQGADFADEQIEAYLDLAEVNGRNTL